MIKVFLFALVCLLISCSYNFRSDELVGEYEVTFDFGRERLVLNADKTYQQEFQYTTGKMMSTTGRWEYPVKCFSERCILLVDAFLFQDGQGYAAKVVRRFNRFIVPKKRGKSIRIEFSADDDLAYEKRSS